MTKLKRKSHLAFNRLKDQLIIINFNSERQFHQTNEVGARIWELCDGKYDQSEIESIIESEFDISSEILHADVTDFIKELKDHELLDS
jgi:hypothetical protein